MSDEIIVDGESVTVIEITTGQIGPVGPEGPQGDPGVVDYTGLVLDDDSRLTDSRTPLSHTHPQSDITNLTTDLGNKADLVDGVVPTAQIPSLAINDTFVVANQSAMLALTAETGDIAIRSDLSKTFVLQASPASTLSNWVELSTPTDVITSVNGQTGSVVLGYSDVGAAPTSHTHANTDITGLGTAAVANTGTGAGTVAAGDDSRFSDARTPTAHTHPQSDVTGLTADLSRFEPLLTPGATESFNIIAPLGYSHIQAIDSTNKLVCWDVYVPEAMTVAAMAIAVRAASTSTWRLGWYSMNHDTGSAALLGDAATVDATTTGIKTITGLGINLPRGWVMFALVNNGVGGSYALGIPPANIVRRSGGQPWSNAVQGPVSAGALPSSFNYTAAFPGYAPPAISITRSA